MYTSGGGFAGSVVSGGEVVDCYSTGAVTGTDAYLGGFCGGNWGDIDDCFWDTETSGLEDSEGGTGKTTVAMKLWTTFSAAYWDIYLDDNDRIWAIATLCNDGYPCLVNVTPSCAWVTILVETDPATGILAHGATLNGDLTSIGSLVPIDVYFEYGVTSGLYPYTTAIQVMTAIGEFHEHISLLQNNTVYYFRAVASDGTSTVYGVERSFTTVSPTSPYPPIVAGTPEGTLGTKLEMGSSLPPVVVTLALVPETMTLKANTRT